MRMVFLGLILFVAGCGYHFPGQGGALPADVDGVYVHLFDNDTREPLLENIVTTKVSEQFSRRAGVRLVSLDDADAEIFGRIGSYSTGAIAYADDDLIRKYRAAMVVEARLIHRQTGRLLRDVTVQWQTEFTAATDKMQQADQERLAQEELARRLAEEVYSRLLDDF